MSLTDLAPTPAPKSEPSHRRENVSALQLVVFPARAFLALGWTRAAVEKLIDNRWWDGSYLSDWLVRQQTVALSFMAPFERLEGAVAVAVSVIVLAAELVIGFCLFTGRRLAAALVVACALNVAFVGFGAVNPSAFYLVLQLTLLLSLYLRLDRQPDRRETAGVAGALLAAAMVAPFVRTLHPHEVIDDPAMMLATLAMLVAATLTIICVDRAQPNNL